MAAPPESGPAASLRVLGARLLEVVGTRAELAVVELRQEGERRRHLLTLSLIAGVFLSCALLFASLFVVVLFWDDHRLAAIAGVGFLYLAVGAAAAARANYLRRSSPPPFEATLAEFARDREMLRGARE